MSDDEILEVVQAHKEGKQIQWKTANEVPNLSWMDGAPLPWDFNKYQYRVAPEPRKPREWILPSSTPDMKGRPMSLDKYDGYIHVREVIEDKGPYCS